MPPLAEVVLNPVKLTKDQDLDRTLFLLAAVVLVALTVWTYAGARETGWRRLLAVLGLRLGALVLAFLLTLRPSFADRDQTIVPSKLLLLADDSLSMNINDEFNSSSRWDSARRMIKAAPVEALLRRLDREQKVQVVYYQASEEVRKFDPAGKATGKRTDMGHWLRSLIKIHGGEQNLRGLVILSDGADNGTRYPTLDEAARWRGIPCPIYTFALGSPTTTLKQQDVAVRAIHADPSPVPVKNKLTVHAVLDAPGLERQSVNVRLLVDDKEISSKPVRLEKTRDNKVAVGEFRPERAGEIKVTVKVEPVSGEVSTLNNDMSTYVSVTAEGVSVLWVEGRKRYESVFAVRHALALDKRFSVFYTVRVKDEKPLPGGEDWFDFKTKHYDVIVIGDITPELFAGGNRAVFAQIRQMVKDKGTGLMMLGGYRSFANSTWQDTALAEVLPVKLDIPGQVKDKVKVTPTEKGLAYLLRLSDGDGRFVWDTVLEPLDEMTRLGTPRTDADVFAWGEGQNTGERKIPVMVAGKFGEGRVLAFGGDTTEKVWRRSEDAIKAYERFWKQVVLWLAKREEADGNVWVVPDVRRVAAGSNNRVAFTVGARGKGGLPIPDARFKVTVTAPDKTETQEDTVEENSQHRGSFWKTNLPGEYTIQVKGYHQDGSEIPGPPGKAKFLAYAEDLESLRPAADHEALRKLASAGGGTAYLGGEDKMVEFLEMLLAQPPQQGRARADIWPDWGRAPLSGDLLDQLAALWVSGLLPCLLLFIACLCTEWYLRRVWGLV